MAANKFDWGKFQTEAQDKDAGSSGKFNWSSFEQESDSKPDGFLARAGKSLVNSLPAVGGVVGGILGTPADAVVGPAGNMVGAGIGGYIGTATKNLINRYIDPQNAPKTDAEAITQPVVGGVTQGLAQGTGEAVAPYLAKGVSAVSGPVARKLGSVAEEKAIAATGATGRQASKFSAGSGRELLDQGIVKFGDNQAAVSQKATEALENSGKKIGDLLHDLDKRGATLDQTNIVASLRKRAAELSDDPSQYSVSDSLNRLADRIQTTIEAKGDPNIPLSKAEATKRGFQTSANYNSSPMDLSISKEAAKIYRQAVEDAATQFDPKSAQAFASEKKQYNLLKPIQDAAQKRAMTLNQSPHGGLMDTVATGVGAAVAGPPGAIAAPIVRRTVSPRIASAMAASANAAGKLLGGAPAIAESAAPAAVQLPSSTVPSEINSGIRGVVSTPAAAQNNQSPDSNMAQSRANRSPATGPDLWAQQGIQKLGIQDKNLVNQLLQSQQGKKLLIQASDLTPNSKAMNKIMDQINSRWGKKR